MKFKFFFALIIVLLINTKSSSHPHVFLYSSIDAVFDEKGLKGFNIYWKFDEMFSNMFIFDFDKNMDKKFNNDELKALKKGGFDNLKKFDYFSHIKINNKKFKVKFVKNFKAWIEKNKLFYSFFIPCHVKALKTKKDVKIAVYDKSFYCSVFLTKKPLYFKDAEKFDVNFKIKKNKNDAYYFKQIYPEEITIKFGLKNE